jgi:ABC-type antimicrobial peptide transport system permease subunit
MGLIRGVTRPALLVRQQVEIEQGNWPASGEVMVGRLVAAKLGVPAEQLSIGTSLEFEGRAWRISGIFSAAESAFESEVWCRLDELQQAMKRQDLSLVAVTLAPGAEFADLDLFCKMRMDLELQAIRETDYYTSLQEDYGPVRMLAWLVVLLVSGAGIFAGLNTMYGSVIGRIPELSMLRTIGFVRRSILISLIQEGMLLAAAASLLASAFALVFVNGTAVRFTMGAFSLRIDSVTLLIGCGVGLLLGFVGAIPPALRALRMPVVDGLKSA